MLPSLLFTFAIVVTLLLCPKNGAAVEIITETELFSFPISPIMFNWTYQEFENQFVYQSSIANKPDLPKWLRYVYSMRHNSGFVYGTPPKDQRNIELDVVGLNRLNYLSRRIVVPLHVAKKRTPARYEVQMKIDNLNVEDMLDEYRMDKLKDIFRRKLWRESANDLYSTFLASAVDLGARLPLKPTEGEGLFVRLGSSQEHSPELFQLEEEVKPLFRLSWCPRDFKRTTVERLFRDAGFNLDWCSFRLVELDYEKEKSIIHKIDSVYQTEGRYHSSKRLGNIPISPDAHVNSNGKADAADKLQDFKDGNTVGNKWKPPKKSALPQRSYMKEFTLAILIPMSVMIVSVVVLTIVLCFQYVGGPDPVFQFFVNELINFCVELCRKRHKTGSKVQVCTYSNTNTPGGATDQSHLTDNISNKSVTGISPNESLKRPYSPRSNPTLVGNFNRPQPPPYAASNANTLPLRTRGDRSPHDSSSLGRPQHNRVLEESLKLLNQANIGTRSYHQLEEAALDALDSDDYILKDPILDTDDGSDDYVQVKREEAPRQNGGPKIKFVDS